MRLKTFILNENRSVSISEDDVRKLIKTDYSIALKGTPIFRGVSNYDKDFLFIDPSKHEERLSPYAYSNVYNLLLSNLPSWNKYPKRNKSIICTTDIDNAYGRGFGAAYYVIPKNNSKIGICPSRDIWFSFKEFGTLNELNNIISILFETFNIKYNDADFKKFKNNCDELDDKKYNIKNLNLKKYKIEYEWLTEYLNIPELKLLDILNQILDPNKNRFKLSKPGDDNLSIGVETWTDGPSILINTVRVDLIRELL